MFQAQGTSMLWPILNIIFGLVVAGIITYRLGWTYKTLTQMERSGMGFIGAAMFLNIAPLISSNPTPYEDWGGTLLRLGCTLFFFGQLLRHRDNNKETVRQAKRHLKRG